MADQETKSNLERLREAWENAPSGAKNLLYERFGYTNQNVGAILRNGRKDQTILIKLIDDLKVVSDEITSGVIEQNKTVQAI